MTLKAVMVQDSSRGEVKEEAVDVGIYQLLQYDRHTGRRKQILELHL